MHTVHRTEPTSFVKIRNRYLHGDRRWMQDIGTWELHPDDYREIIKSLSREFNYICAYCERKCTVGILDNTVDHFRPRMSSRRHTLQWENLVYACKRCNSLKADKWSNSWVDGFVNPSFIAEDLLAQDYFKYESVTGKIYPADNISPAEHMKARWTIDCMDLNSERPKYLEKGEFDPANLPEQRKKALRQFQDHLEAAWSSGIDANWLDVVEKLEDRLVEFSSFILTHYPTLRSR